MIYVQEQQLRLRARALQPPGHVYLTAGGQVGDETSQVVVELLRLVFVPPVFVGEVTVEQQANLLLH